jgi:lipopolysaccharide/colanic/teichoic acid biosynthesis glycosyltransferase
MGGRHVVEISHALKRLIDVLFSLLLLAVASPLLAACAIAIKLTSAGPILFRQTRIGKDERPFEIVKLRTMRPPHASESMFDTDAQRVTTVGRFLRASSLDELPELWNVLRGEMSLVGPRPLLPDYLSLYSPEHRARHNVRPGVTGLAQISGRQSLTFSERLGLDVVYVEKWSLRLDLWILLRTVAVVSRCGGIHTGQRIDDVDDIGFSNALRADDRLRPSGTE